MVDAGPGLDQVASHLDVVVDDGFHQRRPQVFVLSIHVSTGLSERQRSTFISLDLHHSGFSSDLELSSMTVFVHLHKSVRHRNQIR